MGRCPHLVLALGAALLPHSPAGLPQRPNVVLLVADDLGWGELGCYGQTRIETPRLDRMAREGLRFRRHYAGAPVCAPSRCVLLTGMHLGHATIRDNLERAPEGQEPLLDSDRTVAEVLREAGYATGCFGKWGLGFPGSEGDPLRQGFEHFFGVNCQREAHGYYPRALLRDDRRVPLEGNDGGPTGARYGPDVIEAEVLAFLRAHHDRPFFCYVPFTLPHLALQVPEASLARYRGRWEETPYTGTSYLPHPTPRAAYAAMITHLDATVGRILDLLAELGIEDRTLVLFTSDNGPTHLAEQVDCEFFASTGGLRGRKGSLYEGGLRVPLIARWPGRIAPGTTSDHLCGFQDLLPTLAELAGRPAPAGTDGLSYLPTLLGESERQREHEYLFWDFPGYGGQLGLREGRWKAVRRDLRRAPQAPLELYDLDADPGEQHDVAGQHPALAARLAQRMLDARREPAIAAFRFGSYGPD